MPIYDFECGECRTRFEELVRDDASPDCPECGSNRRVKRVPSVFAAHTNHATPDACPTDRCAGGGCPFSAGGKGCTLD